MSFFRQFPLTTYDLQRTGALTRVTDLFRNVTAPQVKLDPTVAYTDYRIIDGARPDVVSQLLYGDPDYYWTFFIINDKLKSGHASWPMSSGQMEAYLTEEYDGYSVIQMSDNDAHEIVLSSTEYAATTVATAAGGDLDFAANPQYIVDLATSSSRQVMKYDPYMQQLWITNSGSSDTFISAIQSAGTFRFSSYSSVPSTLSTLTIGTKSYTQFYPVSGANGQKISSPGVLPYITAGRNAIHHYVFTPQVGDTITLGYNQLDVDNLYRSYQSFYGIGNTSTTVSGVMVVDTIEADVNSYGGIKVDAGNGNIQSHYFTDPRGFLLTAQDVNKLISGVGTMFQISPSSRIVAVTYADYENDLNENRSSIRVVNPTYIRPFVKQYRDLLNA
jgi:hypothetical protein